MIRRFLAQNSALDINNAEETEALLQQDKKLFDALETELSSRNTTGESIFSFFKTIADNIKAKIVVIGRTTGGFISYVLDKRKQKYPTAPLDQRAFANDVRRQIDKSLKEGKAKELTGKGASGGITTYEHESGTLKQEPNEKGDRFSFSVEGEFSGTLEVPRMDKDGNIISSAVDIIEFVGGKVTRMLIATEGICRVNNIDELAKQAERVIGEVNKPVTTQTDVEPIAPQELAAARNQIASLEQRLGSKDKEIAEVDRERKEAIGALEESKRKIIQLQQSTSADSAKQIAIEREKLGAAERRIKESDNLVSILRGELGDLQKSYGEKVQELENRIREGEDALAAQNEQLATASKNLEDEKAKLAEAQQETEALRAEQDKDKKLLKETRQKLKSIKSSVQQKSQLQEPQIMAMQDDIAKMTEAIKARDAEIQASTARYAQEAEILKESNRELEESKQLVQAKVAEMEGELKFAREASKSAQERFDAALGESGDRVKALQDELEAKVTEFAKAQEENERKLLEAQNATKKIEELRHQHSAAAAKQLKKEQAELEKLEGELAKGREESASLTEEIGRLKSSHGEELQRLQEQVNQQEARIASQEESFRIQMAASKERMAEKEAELAKERAEVDKLKREQGREKQEMRTAQSQFNASETEKAALKEELHKIRQDSAKREAEIERAQAEFAAERERFAREREELANKKKVAEEELLQTKSALAEKDVELATKLIELEKANDTQEGLLVELEEALRQNESLNKIRAEIVAPADESVARQSDLESVIASLTNELSRTKQSEAAKQHLAERQEAELAKLRQELATKDEESSQKVQDVERVYQTGARNFVEALERSRQTEKDLDALRTGRNEAGDLELPHKRR